MKEPLISNSSYYQIVEQTQSSDPLQFSDPIEDIVTQGSEAPASEKIEIEHHEGEASKISYPNQESVCGADGRIRVVNHAGRRLKAEHKAVCLLSIKAADGGTYSCTGFFISKRLLLTSGHCVYHRNLQSFATEIEVIPGILDGINAPYGKATSRTFFTTFGWRHGAGSPNDDIGAIVLDDDTLYNNIGNIKFSVRKNGAQVGHDISTVGYPGDKEYATQWKASGSITRRDNNRAFYMADTYGGQSGSPIYTYFGNYGPIALGVHGYGGCPNSAVVFNDEKHSLIFQWLTES